MKKIFLQVAFLFLLLIYSTGTTMAQITPFVSIWDSRKESNRTGNSNTTIALNFIGSNFTVKWQKVDDATVSGIEEDVVATETVPYVLTVQEEGKYLIEAYSDANGQLTGLSMGESRTNMHDRKKLMEVKQWGNTVWTDIRNAFRDAENMELTAVATDLPDLSNVRSLYATFIGCKNLTDVNSNISGWSTGNVEEMSWTFAQTSKFDRPLNWNTEKVTTMRAMFEGASLFNQDISGWDVAKVINMIAVFNGAVSFDQDINRWDVSKVQDMQSMFLNAKTFNRDLASWNTESVTNMSNMFNNALKFNGDITGWKVSNVTNMEAMFRNTLTFNQDISGWNVTNVTNMKRMFELSVLFNQDISGWNVQKVTDMSMMFNGAASFNQNLGRWTLQSLTTANVMFASTSMSCENYSNTLAGWGANPNTASNVTMTNVGALKYNRLGLAGRNALIAKGWTISGDTYVRECTPGETDGDFIAMYDLSQYSGRPGAGNNTLAITAIGTDYTVEWILLNIDDLTETTQRGVITNATSTPDNPYIITFPQGGQKYRIRLSAGIGSLKGFYTGVNPTKFDYQRLIRIEQWGNTQWTKLDHAFYRANKMELYATDIPDLSHVNNISSMFSECSILTDINNNIAGWNVENIENMDSLFKAASLFNRDLNSWNTTNVTSMKGLFTEAKAFNQPLNNWNVSKVKDMSSMFKNAESFDQPLGSWDIRSLTTAEFMFDNPEGKGMECDNYSATLIGWESNSNTPNNITLGAQKRFYNREAKLQHDRLISNKHWNILIDELSIDCGGSSYLWTGEVSDSYGTAGNWIFGIIPKPGATVEFATVDNYGREALNNMKINAPDIVLGSLTNESSKATIIPEETSLTVSGGLYGSETMNEANKLLILSSKDQPNGTLILAGQPASTPVYATVEMYSKAKKGASHTWTDNIDGSPTKGQPFTSSYQWQYIGIPVESIVANDAFYKGFIRKYDEKYNGEDNTKFYQKWRKVNTYDVLTAFTGYEITQKMPTTYYFQGKLNIGDKALTLTREAPEVTTSTSTDTKIKYWGLGQNIFGNSYTASIQIDKIEFPEEVEKTVYLYNTGSFADWAKHPSTTSETDIPGAYLAIPQNVSPAIYRNGIPSMQGFMLKFKDSETIFGGAPATVTLKYGNGGVGRNSKPQKAPSSQDNIEEVTNNIGYIRIDLGGETSADVMWMIEMPNTTDGFDNGYDGYKMMSMTSSATIFTDSKDGHLQVSTSNSVLNKPFSFRSNSVGEYKLTLVKSNLGHYNNLHLVDMIANKYVALDNDSTIYVFTSNNTDKIEKRFMLVNEAPTTGIDAIDNPYMESLDAYMHDNSTLVVNNMTSTKGTVTILDVSGRAVLSRDMQQGFSQIPVNLTSGVYMISLQTAKKTKMVKVIIE